MNINSEDEHLDLKGTVFTETYIRHMLDDAELINYNLMKRGRDGLQTLEMQILDQNAHKSIIVLHDHGSCVEKRVIRIGVIRSRCDRNKEIQRLYWDEGLSQAFLADIFGLAQSSISLIAKEVKKQKNTSAK